ncbi:hypothetical protein ABF236_003402 [Yersinia ruckeri]|nr:hypothetical protein [Yersinia ruckeri]
MGKQKLLVLNSGGATSAFMTRQLLTKCADEYEMIVCFANTTPQLNFPEKPEGWKIGKFGYQDLFNAIGAAVSSPHAGGFSISVKAFEEAMLAATPLQLSELLTAAKPEGLQRHIFSALVNELRDVPAIGCKRALIISALNRHGVVADPIRPGSKP